MLMKHEKQKIFSLKNFYFTETIVKSTNIP